MLVRRRQVLAGSIGAMVAALVAQPWPAVAKEKSNGLPFSFDWLVGRAKEMAGQDYVAPRETQSAWLRGLGYDAYRSIRYKPEKAWWRKLARPFRMEFFHVGSIFLAPVTLHEVDGGVARPITYDPKLFDFGHLDVPDKTSGDEAGYAGFRVHYPLNNPKVWDELFVFLGASYFRSLGRKQVYGLSARGLAVDTALPKGEEFPSFRSFWIERPRPGYHQIRLWALLDSPSVTGAYAFTVTPGRDVAMEVTAKLFLRKDVERLGVAPLTSMFDFGENDKGGRMDFRPEVHDSDGLLIHQGKEWLWRPLCNPKLLSISTMEVKNLAGFGLMQRDRDFSNYQDLEARYGQRPSLWVRPKGDWGKGAVQLVEIPTDSEIHDNIVAYFVPEKPAKAGDALSFAYALTWGEAPAHTQPLAVAATHIGKQFDNDVFKFVIDFQGDFPNSAKVSPQADLWVSQGQVQGVVVQPNPHLKGWRVVFDYAAPGDDPVEMRCSLKANGRQVSETWSYLWSAAKR